MPQTSALERLVQEPARFFADLRANPQLRRAKNLPDLTGLASEEYWSGDRLIGSIPQQWHDGGLSTTDIGNALGVSTRIVIRWVENGYIRASLAPADGHGSRRRYSLTDFIRAHITRQLIGFTRQASELAKIMSLLTDEVLEDAGHVFIREDEPPTIIPTTFLSIAHDLDLFQDGDRRVLDFVHTSEVQALLSAYAADKPTLMIPIRRYKRDALELLANG